MQIAPITCTIDDSSWIFGIDYHQGVLTIDLGTSLYAYRDVPIGTVIGLLTAASKGRYFNEYVREEYDYIRLN